MKDLVGRKISEGDTIVHVMNSSGSIYGREHTVAGFRDEGTHKARLLVVDGSKRGFKGRRCIVVERNV